MSLYAGTIGWSYSFWKGGFYPEKIASKDFLSYYSSKFNSVEVDSTFYRIPTAKAIEGWKEQTPETFKFSLKFPGLITHIKMLKDCKETTQIFLERAALLEEKLGVLLLQFPPLFRIQHLPLLTDYLQALPKQNRFAVEVRNKSLLSVELYSLLKEHNVAFVWGNSPKIPQVEEKTADFMYLRWEGDRKTVNGTLGKVEKEKSTETQNWVNKLSPFLDGGIDVFGYFGKYYSGFPPADTDLLHQLLLGKG
jgi:uncharacterized protein YecE (DUF72 family)